MSVRVTCFIVATHQEKYFNGFNNYNVWIQSAYTGCKRGIMEYVLQSFDEEEQWKIYLSIRSFKQNSDELFRATWPSCLF